MDLEKFSVVSTDLECNYENDHIKKKYSINTCINITIPELKILVDEYLESIQNANIPTPRIVNSYIENDRLVYESEHCGKNIIELGFNISRFDDFKDYVIEMLNLVRLAIKSNIYFDPHPKNFVFDSNGGVFYVDIFPPYTDYLKNIRLHSAKNSERQIINENYQFFTTSFLVEHFCGDFLNIDKNSESIFGEIYSLARGLDIVKTSKKDFIEKAKYIRSIEDLRLERGIYLL